MGTTALGFHAPTGADPVEGDGTDPTDVALLAAQVDARHLRKGIASARPAASSSNQGATYYATDTGDLSLDTGGAWIHQQATARCDVAVTTATSGGGLVVLTLSAPTTVGPVAFSRASSNSQLVVPVPGLYAVSVTVWASHTSTDASMYAVDGGFNRQLGAAFIGSPVTLTGDLRIGSTSATDRFGVWIENSVGLSIPLEAKMSVRRVAP